MKSKKWIFILGGTLATLAVGGIKLHQIRKENDKINSNIETTIGYDNINLLTNWATKKVGDNNFVLIDIKDHNSISILFKRLQLEYCLKNNIDLGFIISSDSTSLSDTYLDLEYLLGTMEKYKANYPVYINVDTFFENEELTYDEATKYINAFLEKATKNHLYIGVTGEPEYLKDPIFDNYSKLPRNTFVKSSDITQDEDGTYYATPEIKKTIATKYFNEPIFFKDDAYHVVSEGENLADIARNYGLSVEDLKKYNNIGLFELKTGSVLRIPTEVQTANAYLDSYEEEYRQGIDVSTWQGNIDWSRVNTDFAIIRVCNFVTGEDDSRLSRNILGCTENGIPMGFYVYSGATTTEGIRKEAQYTISKLQDIDVQYPVYLDLETEFWTFKNNNGELSLSGYTTQETKKFVLEAIKIWEQEILKAGYTPGIYCNKDLFNNLNQITDGYINELATWVAGGPYYDQNVDCNQRSTLPNIEPEIFAGIYQISSQGILDGISDVTGEYVDVNYCYVNYDEEYNWDRDVPNYRKVLNNKDFQIGLASFGAGFLIATFVTNTKKNKKSRGKAPKK